MALITAGDLALIQAEFVADFDSTATVLTFSSASDGAGGQVETYTPGAPVAARIAPMGRGEPTAVRGTRSGGDRVDARTTHVISLPPGTAVTARDRIEMADGSVYEVTAIRSRTDEIIRRAEMMEATA